MRIAPFAAAVAAFLLWTACANHSVKADGSVKPEGTRKAEIPWVMAMEQQLKDRGFAVVGVSMDEDGWIVVKPYIQQYKVNYRILLGNDQVGEIYGGVESLPTTFLIDRRGKIASVHIGLSGKDEFKNAITELLDAPRTTSIAPVGGNFGFITSPR